MATTIHAIQVIGMRGVPISVEVDITPGLHIFSIVGLADKEVQESRERISAAIKNIGALPPHRKSQRVIVNLAPASIRKEGPAFDLPIAIGYLLASRQLAFDPAGIVFVGELGLDGALRRVPGMLPIAIAARRNDLHTLIVPKGCGSEAAIIDGLTVIEASTLDEVIRHIAGVAVIPNTPKTVIAYAERTYPVDVSYIAGQEYAKRAIEIAAAGGHNILFFGPPGTGKTMLAQALVSILPSLSKTELLEVTNIYSIAGLLAKDTPYISERPFRNPHHTASHTAIVGGGKYPRPGEITLAHRGVLFLDELPEFERRVVEALRQPLEERRITITRAEGSETFPAQLILAAAMNPCPCGYYESGIKDCACTGNEVLRYRKRVSGPLLDRIDLHISVPSIAYEKLRAREGEVSSTVRARVTAARAVQQRRYSGEQIKVNAELTAHTMGKYVALTEPQHRIMSVAHTRYQLSLRAHHRILKVARTIADLAGSDCVEESHILEALGYRIPATL